MSEKIFDIAVIGSGAAGSMGALRAVLNNLDTLVFMGDAATKKKARATWVGKVENMPVLFDRPKAVFDSSKEVFQWIKKEPLWAEKLETIGDAVASIEGAAPHFILKTAKGESFHARYIVLCTGIMDVQPEISGSIEPIFPMANQGHIEYCIRCDGHKSKGKNTVIIGHKETAAWIASLLYERYQNPSMTILSNGKALDVSDNSPVKERLQCYGIAYDESAIIEILGDPKGEGLKGFRLESGKVVQAEMAFVSLGTLVYNKLAESIGCAIDERGYVETDESGESSVPGVFIGGDLRANKKKQIYTAWDITVDAVDKIDSYIRTRKREERLPGCSKKAVVEQIGDLFGKILLPPEAQTRKF